MFYEEFVNFGGISEGDFFDGRGGGEFFVDFGGVFVGSYDVDDIFGDFSVVGEFGESEGSEWGFFGGFVYDSVVGCEGWVDFMGNYCGREILFDLMLVS